MTNHLGKWHKIWYADVSGWLILGRHRCRWVLFSFYVFVRRSNCPWACILVLRKKVYILPCRCIQITYPHFIYVYAYYYRPPVRLFTAFSGFFAFAAWSGMASNVACWCIQLTYPTRHRCRWLLLPFHAFVRPSNWPLAWVLVLRTNRLAEKSIFWHADVSRWLTLSLFMLINGYYCLSVRLSILHIFRLLCIRWQITRKEWHEN